MIHPTRAHVHWEKNSRFEGCHDRNDGGKLRCQISGVIKPSVLKVLKQIRFNFPAGSRTEKGF